MIKGNSKFIPLIFSTIDILLLVSSFLFANYYLFDCVLPNKLFYLGLISGWSVLWFSMCLKMENYTIPRIVYIHKILSKNIYTLILFSLFSGGLIFLSTDFKFSRLFFGLTILVFSLLLVFWRIIAIAYIKKYRKKGGNYRRMVVVGMNSKVEELIKTMYTNPNYGYKIQALFTDASIQGFLKRFDVKKIEETFSFLEENRVDELVISLPYHKSEMINKLMEYADNNMIRVNIIPEFSEHLSQSFRINYIANIPVMRLRSEPLQSLMNRVLKRVFDIVFSLFVIITLFSWLFPIIFIIIKATSKGPIFFLQDRTGRDGMSFKCYKFRSMYVNHDSDKKQATKGDKRITPFGAFMRKTSIDELPQIFNVLFNHMSLVGPRPHMLKHTEEYRLLVDKFMVRHFAKPGVTGWAQINGYRGETKEVKDMENRAKADIWYIENWSFLLDLKIIFTTAFNMFFKDEENAF